MTPSPCWRSACRRCNTCTARESCTEISSVRTYFLTVNGSVKLGDFGISKVLEHTASAAKTVIGTPSYLAPEVCESKPYGSKADVWSLGVVLFELLSLQTPFQASNMAAIVIRIVTAEPPPLPEVCGEHVQELVSATLQKLPERRPNTDELLNRPSVRRRVGAKFQPFSTATPKRRQSQEACATSPSSGFTRRDAELLASTLKPCEPHGHNLESGFSAPWQSNEDTLQELVRGVGVGAAVTPTEATRRRGRKPEPAIDQELALEQWRRNQEMAEAIKVRIQGPSSIGHSPGDGYSSSKRPMSSGRLAPPDVSTFSRPGTMASRPGSRGSQSCMSPQAEMGLIAKISGGFLGDQQMRPSSRDGPEATLARIGSSHASLSRPSSRGFILSRPSSRGSVRSASGCAGATIMGLGGTSAEPVEQARPPTASELAGRFAWATKFADAKLDMPLWAGPTGTPENSKRDSLEKIINEFAQMGEGDLESTSVTGRKRTDGGTNFTGARFDDTESWDAAIVIPEPTGEDATLWTRGVFAAPAQP
eukprot:TRINITY_DN34418_c0_g1_i1.p1 TRINITY_DN34418_c0_g1~~TRINITY_DN34418_c0_g1_i1.p1  ORF type:complete len:535 (+),score=61.51 TRINITY_DN34418_c0_g1_i1:349-1953(+)